MTTSTAAALFDAVPYEHLRPRDPSRNRAKAPALHVVPPWASWQGSRVGRFVQFIEQYLVIPKGHGAREPMKLHPYQLELLEDWLDPAARAAMSKIGRGNAKTTTLAAVLVAHLFLEEDADVPVVASTLTQAEKTTYGAALRLVQLAPELAGRSLEFTGKGSQKLEVPSMHSVIYPIADKPDGLQGLDPSIAVLDEAAFASQSTWDALVLAAGKRPVSLAVGIGTPSDLPSNAMLNTERVLKAGQQVPGFRWRAWCAPDGCDYRDEAVWPTANPGLITTPPILGIDALRLNVATSPEWAFRCYRLAQWPTGRIEGAWLGERGAEAWKACASGHQLEHGARTWAGVDMALHGDCAALVLGQWRNDNRFHLTAQVWYPATGTIDVAEVLEAIRRACRDYNVQEIAYDPRFFELPSLALQDEGLPMVEFPQSIERLTPAVASLHAAIQRRTISHDDDPTFTAHILNAVPRYNDRGFTLSKQKSGSKIDAAVAAAMCHYLAAGQPGPGADESALYRIL